MSYSCIDCVNGEEFSNSPHMPLVCKSCSIVGGESIRSKFFPKGGILNVWDEQKGRLPINKRLDEVWQNLCWDEKEYQDAEETGLNINIYEWPYVEKALDLLFIPDDKDTREKMIKIWKEHGCEAEWFMGWVKKQCEILIICGERKGRKQINIEKQKRKPRKWKKVSVWSGTMAEWQKNQSKGKVLASYNIVIIDGDLQSTNQNGRFHPCEGDLPLSGCLAVWHERKGRK